MHENYSAYHYKPNQVPRKDRIHNNSNTSSLPSETSRRRCTNCNRHYNEVFFAFISSQPFGCIFVIFDRVYLPMTCVHLDWHRVWEFQGLAACLNDRPRILAQVAPVAPPKKRGHEDMRAREACLGIHFNKSHTKDMHGFSTTSSNDGFLFYTVACC